MNNVDVHIFWDTNYPQNTQHLLLQVIGQTSPGNWREQPLIENNKLELDDIDTVQNRFLIGGWKFTDEGFLENSLFEYTLSARDQIGTSICTTKIQFTK